MGNKITKWQMLSGVAVIILFIMTIVMYFAIGLGIVGNDSTTYLTGFSGVNSLELFKNAPNAANGKDIYGSALTIIIFSALLIPMVMGSWFIPATKIMLRVGLYILNYLFVIIILILSIVVLAEYIQFINNALAGSQAKTSGLTIAFLIIIGMILPLLTMATIFDKVLFKTMMKR